MFGSTPSATPSRVRSCRTLVPAPPAPSARPPISSGILNRTVAPTSLQAAILGPHPRLLRPRARAPPPFRQHGAARGLIELISSNGRPLAPNCEGKPIEGDPRRRSEVPERAFASRKLLGEREGDSRLFPSLRHLPPPPAGIS